MDYSLKRITARERLPGTHANVGIRNLHNCFADFYFHVLCIIKDRPINFGRLRTIFYQITCNQATAFKAARFFYALIFYHQWPSVANLPKALCIRYSVAWELLMLAIQLQSDLKSSAFYAMIALKYRWLNLSLLIKVAISLTLLREKYFLLLLKIAQ